MQSGQYQEFNKRPTIKKTRFEDLPKDDIKRRKTNVTSVSKKTVKRSMTANSDTFSNITNDNLLMYKGISSGTTLSNNRLRTHSSESLGPVSE